MAGFLLIALTGCAAPAPPTVLPTVSNTPTADSATPGSTPAIIFVKHNIGPDEPFWAGVVPGSLRLIGNCLFILSDSGSEWVAVWPANFRLVQAALPAVVPSVGLPLRIGEEASFFGGELDTTVRGDLLDTLLGGQRRPDECGSNHYWIVTGFERP